MCSYERLPEASGEVSEEASGEPTTHNIKQKTPVLRQGFL